MRKKLSEKKKRGGKQKRNMRLMEFCDKYLPHDFQVDLIPVKHPQTGEKIYLIGDMMMEQWYRKKPGQAGKDGQMWSLMQGLGFDVRDLEVHPDAIEELADHWRSFTDKPPVLR